MLAEPPKSQICESRPGWGAGRPREVVGNIKSGRQTSTPPGLVAQYRSARDALNASLALLRWAIDIRELLQFGLDLDDMKAEVAAFNRAVEAHKAARRRMAA